jgi:hypothetical protein
MAQRKSEARRLKGRLASEKGRRFKHAGFHPLDPEGLILERDFYETGETVRVHLTTKKKIETVYLIRK